MFSYAITSSAFFCSWLAVFRVLRLAENWVFADTNATTSALRSIVSKLAPQESPPPHRPAWWRRLQLKLTLHSYLLGSVPTVI